MDDIKRIVDYFSKINDWNNDDFLQVYEEILNLCYWVKGFEPENILEIGSRGTTFYILNKFSKGKKAAVDLSDFRSRIHMAMYGEDWKFFVGNSQTEAMRDRVGELCNKYDLIFIDGDHNYAGVKKDFELYKTLLSERGVILFHDVDPNHKFPGEMGGGDVARFWQELDEGTKTHLLTIKSSGKNKLWGSTEGFGGIGIWTPG